MRILPVACLLLLLGLHYSTCAERLADRAKAMLGKALVRRARARAELAKAREESKTEEDKAKEMDMLEDIFVGSGSQSVDKTEASGSRREDVHNNDGTEVKGDENENSSSENDNGSGNRGDGGMDSNASGETSADVTATIMDKEDSASGVAQGSGTSIDSMDSTATESTAKNTEESDQETVASSGSSQDSDKSPASPAASVSNIQDTNPVTTVQTDTSKQLENAVSSPSTASGEDATGPKNKEESNESTSKKSDIESSADSEEEDSGSTEAIRKGIESLSRLLTPVASGYQFQLYSGDAQKKVQNEPKEAEGESDGEETSGKGESDNADEMEPVQEKVCRKECHLPMSYEACAVPRCDLKMGTIKDLCFWLCRNQKEVCEQKCEYIERE